MAVWLAGVAVLVAAAWLRGAEYDEQYTLFLTAGVPRPDWPGGPFPAGLVRATQAGHASLLGIIADLRATDVHPPVYFWAVALWRGLFGPGLLAARLLSVLCGAASLALVGRIAWVLRAGRSGATEAASIRFRTPPCPAAAMAMTALCYGFAYTNAIARGFAPAETALLLGVLLLVRGRPGMAGPAFGAAFACNYLAVFPAIAACVVARSWRAVPGMVPFLALDAWCFAAQHGSRTGQFPPFALIASVVRLAEYQVAAVFGGLPLYWDGAGGVVATAVTGVAVILVLVRIVLPLVGRGWAPHRGHGHQETLPPNPSWSAQATTERERLQWSPGLLLLAAAIAPAAGLLVLGFLFNNTPIELRYLSFGLPFLALLASGPGFGRYAILLVQAAGVTGLLLAPRTMQPARAAVVAARPFTPGALALVPAGNDGVGIVGAFGIEAPPDLMLSLVHPGQRIDIPPAYRRVILVRLGQDKDSRTVLPAMDAAVSGPNWRRIENRSNVAVYERMQAGG